MEYKYKRKGIKSYPNADLCKSLIYKDNWKKSGIYCWTNLISGKSYVGSAKYLNSRLSTYYSLNTINKILNKGSSIIYSAILKYGHSNFRLDILEYCEPSRLLNREQYYLDLLMPESFI